MDAASSKRRRAYVPEKVCFVCRVQRQRYSYYFYDFFIRDLSKGGHLKVESPLVRLEYAETLSICGIDSTVFMIEDVRRSYKSPIIRPVFYLDLDPNKQNSFNLERGNLRKLPPMAADKDKAVITRVPNSKRFLVFSTLLKFSAAYITSDVKNDVYAPDDPSGGVPVDFEMYDVDAESWITLPRLCLRTSRRSRWSSHGVVQVYDPVARLWNRVRGLTGDAGLAGVDCFRITRFTFIDVTTLVVKIDLGFMLKLDLASLGEGWKVYKEGCCVASDDKVFVISETVLSSETWCASDVKVDMNMESEEYLELPFSSFNVPTEQRGFRVGRLERKGYVCALQTALRKKNGYPQMVIDVVDVGGDELQRVASLTSELNERDLYQVHPNCIFEYHPTYSPGSTPGSTP